jgi:hypothetical protein
LLRPADASCHRLVPNSRHKIHQRPNPLNRNPDLIAVVQRTRIWRHDTGSGEQKASRWKNIVPVKIVDQARGIPLQTAESGRAAKSRSGQGCEARTLLQKSHATENLVAAVATPSRRTILSRSHLNRVRAAPKRSQNRMIESMANMSWPLRVPLSYGRALNAYSYRTSGRTEINSLKR